jgi:hypothetical protein
MTMVDTGAVDVRAFYERYVTLAGKPSRTWHTGELEYHGNCPWCGGHDRFAFWSSGRYSCSIRASGCGRFGRDVIDFLHEYAGLSFFEACDELNIDPGPAYTRPTHQSYAPDDGPPPRLWQERAQLVIHLAQRLLWSPRGQTALDYLRRRGFTDTTIRSAALGYIPRTNDGRWHQDASELWGFSRQSDPHEGVWLPEGILIPWYAEGQVWKLHIRRLSGLKDGDAKYVQVKGSREGFYNVDSIRVDSPLIVCEGEFDALAGQQVCSEVAAWVATGATTRARRSRWLARMGMASPVLVAYDDDTEDGNGKRAGEEGAAYWVTTLPHAIRWPPWEHDLNEMLIKRHELPAWVSLGVAVATTSMTPTAASDGLARQLDQEKDDQSREDAHATYARLQGVDRVLTPCGPGVIFSSTPLAMQIARGRIGVFLEKAIHPSGRTLEYFFPHEVYSVVASQQRLFREEV